MICATRVAGEVSNGHGVREMVMVTVKVTLYRLMSLEPVYFHVFQKV